MPPATMPAEADAKSHAVRTGSAFEGDLAENNQGGDLTAGEGSGVRRETPRDGQSCAMFRSFDCCLGH